MANEPFRPPNFLKKTQTCVVVREYSIKFAEIFRVFQSPETLYQAIGPIKCICRKLFYFTSLASVVTYFDYGIELGAWTKLTFKISLTLSMLLAAGVTACALLSPKGTRLWKFIYSTRFYIKAFGPFSAIAAYAGAAVHGTEYIFVTDKVVQSEKRESRLLTSVFTLSIIILGAFLAFAFFRYPNFFIPSLSKQDKLPLLSLAVGIVVTHYYLDHLIFTPKYQFARPLLKTLSEPIQAADSNTVHDLKAANS